MHSSLATVATVWFMLKINKHFYQFGILFPVLAKTEKVSRCQRQFFIFKTNLLWTIYILICLLLNIQFHAFIDTHIYSRWPNIDVYHITFKGFMALFFFLFISSARESQCFIFPWTNEVQCLVPPMGTNLFFMSPCSLSSFLFKLTF